MRWLDVLLWIAVIWSFVFNYESMKQISILRDSYELTDQELLDLSDELQEKGIIDGKQ